ncbi:LysR family transcriptional regulator [Cohnella silvisoli]|uniref:LysR family transcriptional regulator n=1 Tax=Cohnella silvisoli TaxID=2873699 RepID=A0ABV1L3B3_9BACL|nr:LysR family transcriptional regulator [Cohnella silvisoli]MCD9026156.1 LysR family transcriptional regulator [Cohnella silvisoli]
MELRQLDYFIQICKEGSFTKAAEVLMVSQPTLSQQIRVLEGEYCTPLFYRVGRGIQITEAGQILFDKGLSVKQLIEESRKEIYELKNIQRGELTIGVLPGDLFYLMPHFAQFREQYPDISLKFVETVDFSEQVLQNKIDIGITTGSEQNKHTDSIHLTKEEQVLIIAENHPWAENATIPFRELQHLDTVLFFQSTMCREFIDSYVMKSGITLNSTIVAVSSSSILSMVNHGYGVALLSLPLVESYNHPKIKIIRLTDPTPTREIKLSYHKNKFRKHTVRTFIERLRWQPSS